jgi:hypothetical protein
MNFAALCHLCLSTVEFMFKIYVLSPAMRYLFYCHRGRSQTMGRWCSWCARRSSTRSLSVANNSSDACELFLLLSFGILQVGSGKCRAQLLVLLVLTPVGVSACFGAFFMAHCNYAFGDATMKHVRRRRREIPILVGILAFSGPFRKWGVEEW